MASFSSEEIYESGKAGHWNNVLEAFESDPLSAGKAVRYTKKSSGWSLLHQAAFWNNRDAVAACLKYGADLDLAANDSKLPHEVAAEEGHEMLSIQLKGAKCGSSLWRTDKTNSALRASSSKWSEHKRCESAQSDFIVAYGGGEVHIHSGDEYFTDSWGRVLVGWHGSYRPPCGMDGESMLH